LSRKKKKKKKKKGDEEKGAWVWWLGCVEVREETWKHLRKR
jgi:hypothetical protein